MKRMLILLAMIVTLGSLASACETKEKDSSDVASDVTIGDGAETESSADKFEPIQLELALTEICYGPLRTFASNYGFQNAGIKVSLVEATDEAAKMRVMADLMNGSGPDVLLVSKADMEQLFSYGALRPVSECISEETRNAFYPNILGEGIIDGELVGVIPYVTTVRTFIARKDVLTAEEHTLDRLMELKRTKKDVKRIYTYLFDDMDLFFETYSLFGQDWMHSQFVDAERGKSLFNEKAFRDVLELLKQENDVKVGGEDYLTSGEILAEFTLISGPFAIFTDLYDKFGESGGIVGFPTPDGGKNFFQTDGFLVINRNSEHVKEISDFLEFALSAATQVTNTYFLSVRSDVLDHALHALKPEEFKKSPISPGLEYRYVWAYGAWAVKKDFMYIHGADTLDEMREEYHSFMESIVPFDQDNAKVFDDVIWPEIEEYLAGNKSVEATAETIDRRVQLYLDER
ncbi:MAG: carbohydrate ABC transporter substrate-binding protein [Lachnospiraceae bacterium]|nr:carbohydrate ABC transporter substrate-binding protein [Lachnospiraceae bacterium]